MSSLVKTYPFDPTGENPENLVTGEEHILTGQNSQDFQIIVPRVGPYYFDSLRVSFRNPDGTPRHLTRGRDWVYSHKFMDATHSLASPVYASICFTDRRLTGTVVIDYQNLGGDWVINEHEIETMLADRMHNPPVTSWEQVIERPIRFPVIRHDFDVIDIHGPGHVIESLKQIEIAIRETAEARAQSNPANPAAINNPDEMTRRALGIDKVRNITTLPLELTSNTSDDYLLTPASLYAIFDEKLVSRLSNDSVFMTEVRKGLSYYSKQEVNTLLANKLDTNGKAANTALFDGHDLNSLKRLILQGKANDSSRLEGYTLQEIVHTLLTGVSAETKKQIDTALSNFSTSGSNELGYKTIQQLPANQNSYTFDVSRYNYFKLSINAVPQVNFINFPRGKAVEITIEVDTSMPAKTSLVGYESNIFNFKHAFHYVADVNSNRPGKKIINVASSDGGKTLFVRVFAAPTLYNAA